MTNKDLDFMLDLDIDNMDDMAFESFLAENLSSVEAPGDLHSRIMSSVALEMAAEMPKEETVHKAKIFAFPARRFAAGLGTCAAAMALMLGVGVLGDDVNQVLNPTAPEIVIDKPEIPADDVEDVTGDVIDEVVEPVEPTVPDVEDTVEPAKPVVKPEVKPEVPAVTEPTVPEVVPEVDENADVNTDADTEVEDVQTGDVEMPTAAYGTEATGAVAVRMVAEVEESKAYAPVINDKGSKVLFYTEDNEKLYQWQGDLKTVAEPTAMLITEAADAEFCDEVLVNTTAVHTMNTIVFAPDNTWMAINSRGDKQGVWLSADSGKDLWQLCTEGGGDLLAWAPNSSKFLFTDGSGRLYAAYPVEQRIFLVSDLVVTDIAWAKDSTTVAFVANTSDGYNAVYTVEIP